jgi:hypothetical protein
MGYKRMKRKEKKNEETMKKQKQTFFSRAIILSESNSKIASND